MEPQTFTVRVDSSGGRLDSRNLRELLGAVEDYLQVDRVDMDDEAAIVACNLLQRHFNEDNTPEADWATPLERAAKQAQDFEDAHTQGMHDGVPREGCPSCELQKMGR